TVVSAAIAVAFSFGTGMAVGLGLLVLFRFGNGIGLVANSPVHSSLLSDFYRQENRPAAFGVHRTSPYIGAAIGPAIAGLCAHVWGWRSAFFIMSAPVALFVFFAL